MGAQFRPVKSRRLSDEIGEQVRRRLASGELRPGDKLPSERELALQLKVSRNAVREALRMLEMSGVLTLQKGARGGAFIGKGDSDFLATGLQDMLNLGGVTLEQLTEARVWLAEVVTRIACERATDEDFEALERNIAQAEEAFDRGDLEEKLRLQVEFHNILASATRNPVLSLIMASLSELMLKFARMVGPEENDVAIKSRRRFMPLLRERNAPAAIAEMSDHLNKLKSRYVSLMLEREQAKAGQAKARRTTSQRPARKSAAQDA